MNKLFADNASVIDAEIALIRLMDNYYASADCRAIHNTLLSQFSYARGKIQLFMLRYIRKIHRDVQSISIDITEILESPDAYSRIAGREFVRIFWRFYENDEAVVYALRNYKKIYPLFARNAKYKEVYARKIKAELGAGSIARGVCPKLSNKYKILQEKIASASSAEALANVLKEHCKNFDADEKKITEFFIQKAQLQTNNGSGIPGIGDLDQEESSDMELDLELELELLGLKAKPLYEIIACGFASKYNF